MLGTVKEMDLNQDEPGTLRLVPELDIKAAAPLVASLAALRGNHLAVDASQVTRAGAQCLQVMLSAAATWQADGFDLELQEPSPAFTDAVHVCGLEMSAFVAGGH